MRRLICRQDSDFLTIFPIFVILPVEHFEIPRAFPQGQKESPVTKFVYSSVVVVESTRPVALHVSGSDPTFRLEDVQVLVADLPPLPAS